MVSLSAQTSPWRAESLTDEMQGGFAMEMFPAVCVSLVSTHTTLEHMSVCLAFKGKSVGLSRCAHGKLCI